MTVVDPVAPVATDCEIQSSAKIDRIVIINDFSAANGGATLIAILAAREFRHLGYTVTYICGDENSEALSSMGVEQVAIGNSALLEQPAWRSMTNGLHNRRAARIIAQWIAANDTAGTIYHLHNWSQILSPSVFKALQQVEDRLVVTCHDFFNICPNGAFTHFRDSRPCRLAPMSAACLTSQCDRRSLVHKYWRSLRHARLNALAHFSSSKATFTFLNEQMKQKFVESGFTARDLVALPNPVQAWTGDRITAECNEGFLFVGRIGRDKGADLAIAAAQAAGQSLTLIGSGEIGPSTSTKDTLIRFEGWKSSDEIVEYACRARALIAPSRMTEAFGLVLLEAAISGLPVICTRHAMLADQLTEIGAGMSFDLDQPGELAELLSRLANDDTVIERMSRSGFSNAKSLCHTSVSWAAALNEIYRRKIAHASGQAS